VARDELLVERFLRAMQRVPGIEVLDRAGLVLRVRTADERSVRVHIERGAIAATVRRVSGDPQLGGLAGADDVTRSFTLFLLELQAALSAPASPPVRCLNFTARGMLGDQLRTGMLPA
jgi:hypothetical protein